MNEWSVLSEEDSQSRISIGVMMNDLSNLKKTVNQGLVLKYEWMICFIIESSEFMFDYLMLQLHSTLLGWNTSNQYASGGRVRVNKSK